MGRNGNPARLVIALSVAAVLGIFLLYTSIAGGTPSLQPSDLRGRSDRVLLAGRVIGRPAHDPGTDTLRFRLRDVEGRHSVLVAYRGSVPDPFRTGRDVAVEGRLRNGIFVAEPDTLVTKCPSKYTAKQE